MDAGKRQGRALAVLILIALVATGAIVWGFARPSMTVQPAPNYTSPSGAAASVHVSTPSGAYFDYVVVILMENHAICTILQNYGGCTSGGGPYETSLAKNYSLATKYVKCTTPSLPNYLCLSAASYFGCNGYDGAPHSNTCTNIAWKQHNLVDTLLNNSLTFKAYMENMPTNCDTSTSGQYAVKHDGWVYFSNNVLNTTRCNMIIPAGTGDSALLNDLNSTSSASNYMWLTPNLCNDMHDCSVSTGDNYLKGLVPKILSSPVFTSQRAALFITFDEDSGTTGAPYLYTVWAGPVAKRGYISSSAYSHYSLLATVESNWNLPPLNTTDGGAPNMDEFFNATSGQNPTARFAYAPAWPQVNGTVTFNASASTDPDPNATLQYRWDWTHDGTWDTGWSSTPTATYAYGTAGTYTAALEVQDSHGHTSNSTAQVVVDSEPPVTTATPSGTSGNSGWWRSSVSVKLSATDDLSGVASTKYRKDGGTWTTYSSAVTVSGDGTHTFDYYSVDNAGNAESTQTLSLKIDSAAPTTTATLQGNLINNSYYNGPVNVTLSATDSGSGVASTQYRVDNGSWTAYASPVTVSGNGTHLFEYYSKDVAGNTESTKTVAIFIGSAPDYPVSMISLAGTAGNAGWYTSTVTVTLSAYDPYGSATTVNYSLDNGTWKAYTAPFTVSDGKHMLRYNATDALGKAEPTQSYAFNVDTHAPTTTATLQGTLVGTSYTGPVNVTLSASDGLSGIAGTAYKIDSGAWHSYAGKFQVTGNGTHTLSYNSTDVAGNREATKTKQVVIGTSAPPTTTAQVAGNAGSAGWYTSNVTVTLDATDPAGATVSIHVRIDNGSWQVYAGAFVVRDGRHMLDYWANDTLGHSESVQAMPVDVDTTPPHVTVNAPSGTVGSGNVQVSWSVSDALSGVASIQVSVDGGAFQDLGAARNLSLNLPDGGHTVTVKAQDAAGNVAQQSASFTVSTGVFGPNGPFSGVVGFLLIVLVPLVLTGIVLVAIHRRSKRRRKYM